MSAQPKFKIKRPHSPDHIGICNYKKQRLLFDLESLSLHDEENRQLQQRWHNHQRQVQKSDLHADSTDDMYLPYTTSSHPLKVLQSDHALPWDSDILYARLNKSAQDQRLQVVKWVDMKQLSYAQWIKWIQTHFVAQDLDYDMDHEGLHPRCAFDNDADEDVDMDAK